MRSAAIFMDVLQCSTRTFLDEFWECRMERLELRQHCPYMLRFGDTHFCRHPDRSRFVRSAGEEECRR
jgi:hypothetical protein